ncbi:MAG: hypothetical protein JJU33_03985 [Phycisphaerales bacterium]|nr:hypothetical protein [Phycisphaerales bacterium]
MAERPEHEDWRDEDEADDGPFEIEPPHDEPDGSEYGLGPVASAGGAGARPPVATAVAGDDDDDDGPDRPDPSLWMIQPGWPRELPALYLGLALGAVAMVIAGVNAERAVIVTALLTVLMTWMTAALGVVSLHLTAWFTVRTFNEPMRGATRMLVVSSLFVLLTVCRWPVPGRIVDYLIAILAYGVSLVVLFRLPRYETLVLGSIHLGLWLVLQTLFAMVRHTAAPV